MIHLLISKYELSEYLFSGLEDVDTIFVPVQKHNPLRYRIVKAIYYKVSSKIYSDYFDKDVSNRLKAIAPNDTLIVIGEDVYSYWVLSHICKHIKHKVAYFWNSCISVKKQKVCRKLQGGDKAKLIVEYIRQLGFMMATFDPYDAEKYSMHYHPQFYRSYPVQEKNETNTEYDFFFCGRDKGRRNMVEYFQERLSKFGKCKFIIIPDKDADYFTYFDYLDVLKKVKVLCEICQDGQVGLTVRTLEAVFHGKKLITTNTSIKNIDFYKPSNILVLSSETTDAEIESFLNKDRFILEQDVIQKYEVSTMLYSLNKYSEETQKI